MLYHPRQIGYDRRRSSARIRRGPSQSLVKFSGVYFLGRVVSARGNMAAMRKQITTAAPSSPKPARIAAALHGNASIWAFCLDPDAVKRINGLNIDQVNVRPMGIGRRRRSRIVICKTFTLTETRATAAECPDCECEGERRLAACRCAK